jgi:hypothetical protein
MGNSTLLKSRSIEATLKWLGRLRRSEEYPVFAFSANSDATIFSTCFAIFNLHLFGRIDSLSPAEKSRWIGRIQEFQNEEHGYFEPSTVFHEDVERNCFQLTCFCLSALDLLGANAKHPLTFVYQWKDADSVANFLIDRGCHKGKGGSGNKAMFLAIFLTYEYERTQDENLLEAINSWFDFHDSHSNPHGFWGQSRNDLHFHGLQNGFHQMVIYEYWKREIPGLERAVDTALRLQDQHGFFSPTPGGSACPDYDAIHLLLIAYRNINYRRADIEKSLRKAFEALFDTCDDNGGFCQSRRRPSSLLDLLRLIPFYVSNGGPYLWYYRLRKCLGVVVKDEPYIYTGWTEIGRTWDESNLWDTWFRCSALAEIANSIELEDNYGFRDTNFHQFIGLGFFQKIL